MFQFKKAPTKAGYPLFLVILVLFIFPLQSFGFKIISNDTAFADRAKPLIVLNIPSSDCIMCRAISIKILKELSDSIYRSRLIVLSDTKGMSFFYHKNDSVFNGFEKVYNPEYSAAYADSLSSTLCLLTNEKTQIFPLKKVNDSILNQLRKSIASAVQIPKTQKDATLSFSFVDSLLPGGVEYENAIFDGKSKVAVFNSQIQLGYVADLSTGSVVYDESDIDTNTMKYLIAKLKKMGIDSTCDLAKTLKTE